MKETDYTFNSVEVYCDNCNHSKNFDETDYSSINKELKEEGWIVRKIDGEWCDFCCKECYREYIE